MEDHHAASGALHSRHEQGRWNNVAFETSVFDALPGVAVQRRHVAAFECDGHMWCKAERTNGSRLTLLRAVAATPSIRGALHEPRHDRVESFLIERMPTLDTELGNEVSGHLGDDLIRIARVLVLGARHHQRWARADG